MAKQSPIPGSKRLYEFGGTYKRQDELASARHKVDSLEEVTFTKYLSDFLFTREGLQAGLSDHAKRIKEIITGKRLKAAEDNLKQEQMLFDAANRMYQLTGSQLGEKSGVIKSEKIAEKKITDLLHSIKIAAAMILAYGKNDEQKKQVMKELGSKYPEIVKETNELANKARARAKANPFKSATMKLKNQDTKTSTAKIFMSDKTKE